MGYRFAILGAGRQGVAAAYDLARFGSAARIRFLDRELPRARAAAARINRLLRRRVASAVRVDAGDGRAVASAIQGCNAVLSAASYRLNVQVTRAAIQACVPLCDLGGNTGIVQAQRKLNAQACKAGVAIMPDCGLAPGLGNVLAVYALERLAARGVQATAIHIYCGGLPLRRLPPLGYKLLFNMEGLINEYLGYADYLRNGRLAKVETLSELETLDFPAPVGRCEAFVTSGGLSRLPLQLRGRLRVLEYKTVRYPGHCEKIRTLRDLGLLDERPIDVRGKQVVPQELFAAAAAPHLDFPREPDLVVLRVVALGESRSGRSRGARLQLDLLDRSDPRTGFTAMERTTGFPTAIVALGLARGELAPGVRTPEAAVNPGVFVRELARRGLRVRERWERKHVR